MGSIASQARLPFAIGKVICRSQVQGAGPGARKKPCLNYVVACHFPSLSCPPYRIRTTRVEDFDYKVRYRIRLGEVPFSPTEQDKNRLAGIAWLRNRSPHNYQHAPDETTTLSKVGLPTPYSDQPNIIILGQHHHFQLVKDRIVEIKNSPRFSFCFGSGCSNSIIIEKAISMACNTL